MNEFDNFRVIDGAIYEGESPVPEPIITLTLQYWDGRAVEIETVRIPSALRHKGTVFVMKDYAARYYKELDLIDTDVIRVDCIRAEYQEKLIKAERDIILMQLDDRDGYTWQERCRAWRNHETCGDSVYQVYMAVQDLSKISLEELDQHVKKLPPMFLKPSNDQSQRWDSERGAINSYPQNPAPIDYLAKESSPAMLDLKFSKIIRETRTIRLQDPNPEN